MSSTRLSLLGRWMVMCVEFRLYFDGGTCGKSHVRLMGEMGSRGCETNSCDDGLSLMKDFRLLDWGDCFLELVHVRVIVSGWNLWNVHLSTFDGVARFGFFPIKWVSHLILDTLNGLDVGLLGDVIGLRMI
ncbi:hypothetical protein Tco_0688347 [Tanacetum coccineum]